MSHRLFGLTVVTIVGLTLFSSALQAGEADGVARVNRAHEPYYIHVQPHHRQPPNPTYWTWMPGPFHGRCDYCADPGCHGGKGIWTFPVVRWMLDPDYYALAPDYGFSLPSRVPVRRRNVTYTNYHPEQWYGLESEAASVPRYPAVATPTDTTQLGHYYQQVPTWQTKNILPPAPDPRHWHSRPCVPDRNMSYVKWVRLKRAWVPVDQIPHMRPTPASPEEQDTQQQKSDQEAPTLPKPAVPPTPPTPVEPNFPENAPEALNIPEISEPIRRVRNN